MPLGPSSIYGHQRTATLIQLELVEEDLADVIRIREAKHMPSACMCTALDLLQPLQWMNGEIDDRTETRVLSLDVSDRMSSSSMRMPRLSISVSRVFK
jgi:hypothetical protein